ncbi:MAG: 4-hydroxy-tetrahydrodipicolinate synthase [Ignavibacteriaceae bacterium]
MFKGTGTALITPFDTEFNLDFPALNKIIDHQLKNNVDALIVLGTTGESPVITMSERERITAAVIERVNGKIPVIIGTGTNDTMKVIELNKLAEKQGADAVLIVNPYYNKGTQSSLIQHYRMIAENTNLRIIIYNVPSRTAMNILPETILAIHEKCPNVVAVKEASGDISQIAYLMSVKPDSLSVLSGNDDQTLPIMALGGEGVISVFSNPFPAEMKQITDAMLKNDLNTALKFNKKYIPMMRKLFVETSPAPVKYVMSKAGFCMNVLRLPLLKSSAGAEAVLDEELKNYSLKV